jgi:hypothetical protein
MLWKNTEKVGLFPVPTGEPNSKCGWPIAALHAQNFSEMGLHRQQVLEY